MVKVFLFDRYHDKVIVCVKLKDVIQLAKIKFPHFELKQSVPLILGSVKSMNLVIEI